VVHELIERDETDLAARCLARCGHLVNFNDYWLCKAKSREIVRLMMTYRCKPAAAQQPYLLHNVQTLSALEGLVVYGGVDVDTRGQEMRSELDKPVHVWPTLLEMLIQATVKGEIFKRERSPDIDLIEADQQPIKCAVRLVLLGASLFTPCESNLRMVIPMEDLFVARNNSEECRQLFDALVEACADRHDQLRRTLQPHLLNELITIVSHFYDIQPNSHK